MLGRRRRLPVERRPALEREERILAWAERAGSTDVIVATNRGLWLPGGAQPEPVFGGGEPVFGGGEPPQRFPGEGSTSRRLGWAEIHKAAWSGQELAVTPAAEVTSINGYAVMADQPAVRYTLAQPGDVPHQVRARVTHSVAYTIHHALPGGGGVRIAARRVPGRDGLRWTVRYDGGAEVDDPVVRELTAQLVAQAQAAIDQ